MVQELNVTSWHVFPKVMHKFFWAMPRRPRLCFIWVYKILRLDEAMTFSLRSRLLRSISMKTRMLKFLVQDGRKYTKYDIWCHMVSNVIMVCFGMTLLMNKWTNIVMDDGWLHPLAKTQFAIVNNLWWIIVMDNWNLDETSLGKWQWWQHCKSIITLNNYKDWQHLVLVTHASQIFGQMVKL